MHTATLLQLFGRFDEKMKEAGWVLTFLRGDNFSVALALSFRVAYFVYGNLFLNP